MWPKFAPRCSERERERERERESERERDLDDLEVKIVKKPVRLAKALAGVLMMFEVLDAESVERGLADHLTDSLTDWLLIDY